MVRQLVQDMIENEHPIEPPEGAILDGEDPSALEDVQFFVKSSGARQAHDYRHHCSQLKGIPQYWRVVASLWTNARL
jgi:hypothetical protein